MCKRRMWSGNKTVVETAFDRKTALHCSFVSLERSWSCERIKMNLKFKFNRRLVPICTFYFFITFSFNLVFPYFTILLRSLGLSLEDASLIGKCHLVPWLLRAKIVISRWNFSFCSLPLHPIAWLCWRQGEKGLWSIFSPLIPNSLLYNVQGWVSAVHLIPVQWCPVHTE